MIRPRIVSLPFGQGMAETAVSMPTSPAYGVSLGSFESGVAAVVRAQAQITLGSGAQRVKVVPDGGREQVLAGPFEDSAAAAAASEKLNSQMNLKMAPQINFKTEVVPLPAERF
jgi:cell division protein FtsN